MKRSIQFSKMSIALAAFFILFTTQIQAQDEDHKRGAFGVRFMPTFSSFDMKTSDGGTVSGEGTLGFGAGIFGAYNFTPVVGVQLEILYSSITQKYKETDVERKVTLRYVNIPLLFSLNTGKEKTVNFNIVAGPQIGLSVGSRIRSSGADSSTTLNPVLAVKKGDIGFAYGAGIDIGLNPAKTIRLGFGFRGVYGLLDISNNNGSASTDSYYILDKAHIKTYAGYVGLSILF